MKNSFSFRLLTLTILFSTLTGFLNLSAFGKGNKNVILIIGDGIGVAQWQAGLIANKGQLNLKKFENIGFLLTHTANSLTGAAPDNSTAIATGVKSYMGAVSVNTDTIPVKSIIEYAEENGISTGIVSANTLLEGGIAPFVAHEKSRKAMENIAASYLTHNLDVFIGAGSSFFTQRKDGRNLLEELRQKDYQVVQSMDSIRKIKSGKLAGLTADQNNLGINEGRGSMFPDAVQSALNILSKNEKQFFLFIADVFADRASHSGNAELVALETIDLDRAIGKALEFARKDKNTVVIVASGPEASGMALTGGNIQNGTIEAKWAVPGMIHTGTMVPIFAFGPSSDQFKGIQDNTDLFGKMMDLLGLKTK
jgi:alkaline phosphatase